MSPQTLRVAGIQMVSENGAVEANLRRAARLVDHASKAGAKLVVLPELFSTGYLLSEKAWEAAEPEGGKTQMWLCEAAQESAVLAPTRNDVDAHRIRGEIEI